MSTVAPRPASATRHGRGSPRGRHRGRWIVLVALLAALVAVLAYAAVGLMAYRQISTINHPGCIDRRFTGLTPADFVATSGADPTLTVDTTPYRFTDYRDVTFKARDDDIQLAAWFAPAPSGPSGRAVILVPGYDTCKSDPVVLLPAGMLHRAGYSVLLFDLRNHGASELDNGRWAGGAKEYRDVLGAWDWLIAEGYAPERIGVFGASLGAATADIATGEEGRIAATWSDSAYASFQTAAEEYAEAKGFPGWVTTPGVVIGRWFFEPELGARDPAGELARLGGRPFAIVHSGADSTVLPHNAADLAAIAATAGTVVEPWIIPGVEHTDGMLKEPTEYEQRLLAFFDGALGRP
jgi:dipeptidyl aminopeptidase/acylaminoacyl peptidase